MEENKNTQSFLEDAEDEDKKKEFSKDKDDEEKPAEDKCPECGKPVDECKCDEKDKKDNCCFYGCLSFNGKLFNCCFCR